jgi:hypothetical protein
MLQNEQQLIDIAALIAPMEGTDKEVTDICNAKSIMRYRSLSSSELNKWAAAHPGTRKIIFQAAEDYDHPQYDYCAAAKFAMENTQESLDMNDPVVQGMISQIPIAADAKADLFTLAEDPISPATEAGLPEIKEGYVQEARKL